MKLSLLQYEEICILIKSVLSYIYIINIIYISKYIYIYIYIYGILYIFIYKI